MSKDLNWLRNRLEWLMKINNMDSSSFSATKREAYSDALDLVNQLDDSEVSLQVSPVIPQFVADFLTGKEDYYISDLFNYNFLYDVNGKIAKWLYDNDEETNKERELSLILAHYGEYTVEKQYRLKAGGNYLYFNLDGTVRGAAKDNATITKERLEQLPFDVEKAVESGAIGIEELEE